MFNPSQFDPSKLDPKVMQEVGQLVQSLPPHQLQRLQSLMHNQMAGFDVAKEMMEFERELPPEFREKLFKVFMGGGAGPFGGATATTPANPTTTNSSPVLPGSIESARRTVLEALKSGQLTVDDAYQALFSGS